MTGFPLADLAPALLEKVITKLDEKSYFRLQQTCHNMYDFVRRSENISIHLEGKSLLCFTKDWSKKELRCMYFPANKSNPKRIDLANLHGTRLTRLLISKKAEDFYNICCCIKKHRLTCLELDLLEQVFPEHMRTSYGQILRRNDMQILALLNIVTPRKVYMEGNFESLFHSKSIESVHLQADVNIAVDLFPRLLQTFPFVYIYTRVPGDQFILLQDVLMYFYCHPLPNVRSFVLKMEGGTARSETEFGDMVDIFPDFNLTEVADDDDWLIVDFEMPEHFTLEVCQVTLHPHCQASIYCGKRGKETWRKRES